MRHRYTIDLFLLLLAVVYRVNRRWAYRLAYRAACRDMKRFDNVFFTKLESELHRVYRTIGHQQVVDIVDNGKTVTCTTRHCHIRKRGQQYGMPEIRYAFCRADEDYWRQRYGDRFTKHVSGGEEPCVAVWSRR